MIARLRHSEQQLVTCDSVRQPARPPLQPAVGSLHTRTEERRAVDKPPVAVV